MKQYEAEVKQRWGNTATYEEFASRKNVADPQALMAGMNSILAAFAQCMQDGGSPDSAEAQVLVKTLQDYITQRLYTCTKEILAGLGQMYVGDERFKSNIDSHGDGTAAFISKAIEHYCH